MKRLGGRVALGVGLYWACQAIRCYAAPAGDKGSSSATPGGYSELPIKPGKAISCEIRFLEKQELKGPVLGLPEAYNTGQWSVVQRTVRSIIDACSALPAPAIPAPVNGDTYSLLFLNDGAGTWSTPPPQGAGITPSLARVVYRIDPYPPPFTARLVGPTVYDLHLSIAPEKTVDKIVSAYRARRQPNPILSNIPKLLGQFAAPGFKAAGAGFKTLQDLAGGPAPGEEPAGFTVVAYQLQLGDLDRADVTITDTPVTEDAQAFATGAPKPKFPAALTTAYSLAPLTRIDFSAGTGVILKTGLNTPVKVENGKLVEDTGQTGVLTSLNLNIHLPYDDSYATPTAEECWRLFAGPVLTPDVGLAAGVGWGFPFLRGVGLEAGYGVLLANVLRKGDQLGQAPTNPKRTSYRGAMGVAFVGLTFTP